LTPASYRRDEAAHPGRRRVSSRRSTRRSRRLARQSSACSWAASGSS